jgi:hypothetical protein
MAGREALPLANFATQKNLLIPEYGIPEIGFSA